MSIAIPAKCAVSQMIDYLKDKSAIHLARMCGEHKRNFFAQCPCARGYFASTVDRDAAMIREYIKNQEQEDQRLDHLNVWS